MPRLSLKPLPAYGHEIDLVVRTTDLNYGGHLGNDRLLALLHEARVAFLAAEGWRELDCGGVALIMGDAALEFKGEAFAGDVLVLETGVAEVGRAGFRLAHRVSRRVDGALIALAETGQVGYDYERGRIAPLPDGVRETLRERVS
jgi:acyl-CoA thioesterase FadM